jgi:hypothetical protein
MRCIMIMRRNQMSDLDECRALLKHIYYQLPLVADVYEYRRVKELRDKIDLLLNSYKNKESNDN